MSAKATQVEAESEDSRYTGHRNVDEDSECPACGHPYYRRRRAPWLVDEDYIYEHMVRVPEFGEDGDDWYRVEKCGVSEGDA